MDGVNMVLLALYGRDGEQIFLLQSMPMHKPNVMIVD